MIIGYEAKRIFHNRSGLGNYGRNLIRGLQLSYPQLELRLYNPWPGDIPFETNTKVIECRPNQGSKLYAQLWRRRFVSKQAKSEGVELFHGLSAEIPQGLRQQGIRSIVSIHDLIFLRYPHLYKALDRKIYERKMRKACKNADLIVAISDQTRSDLIELLGISPSKIKVIGQGCAPEFWEDHKAAGREFLASHQLPSEYALFVGTLEPRKNPVKVAQACIEEGLPLIIVGREKSYWKSYYQQLSPEEKKLLHLVKGIDQKSLAGLYQNAKMLVYPSDFEGFGIPLVEAMASKTAVVSAKNSALKEVAGPGSQLLPNIEIPELRKAIRLFWNNEAYRLECIAKNSNYVEQFKDAIIARQWHDTYQKILGHA